jgi:hypothetical protein
MRGASASLPRLHSGHGAPDAPQPQARSPSHGRSGCSSQTQPDSLHCGHAVMRLNLRRRRLLDDPPVLIELIARSKTAAHQRVFDIGEQSHQNARTHSPARRSLRLSLRAGVFGERPSTASSVHSYANSSPGIGVLHFAACARIRRSTRQVPCCRGAEMVRASRLVCRASGLCRDTGPALRRYGTWSSQIKG